MSTKQVSTAKLTAIWRLMQDGKLRTCSQAADEIGMLRTTASSAMAILHEDGEVHIADWTKLLTGGVVAVYKFGKGEDVPRPSSNPKKQAENKRRAKERAESEQRRVERERIAAFVPFRDPLTAAFYGEYQRAV